MKNKQLKLTAGLTLAIALSFAFFPFSADAATTTPSLRSKMQVRPTLTAQNRGTSTLRARATSSATSTRPVRQVKLAKNVEEALTKADKEITKRIDSLNKTVEKVSEMKNVSDSEKASIKSDVQAEITKLEALKSKINSDVDLATIKKDLASIATGSRIYMLVIPRMNIMASVDKVNTISTMLETITQKLVSRIDELKASGTDTTDAETALANIAKKITNARSEALTAETSVEGLVPDNGDRAKIESNNVSLKSARANIKTANQDLNDARKLVASINSFLKTPEKGFNKTEKVEKKDLKNTKVKPATTKKK